MAEVKGPGSLWSEAEDDVVREAYRAERVDIGAAAARVGRTPMAVASRAKRLGVQSAGRTKPRPRGERCPRTPAEIQQAAWWAGVVERVYASLPRQGTTVEDVADRLKLLRAIVRGALYALEAEGKVRRQERVGGTRTWHVVTNKESALWRDTWLSFICASAATSAGRRSGKSCRATRTRRRSSGACRRSARTASRSSTGTA